VLEQGELVADRFEIVARARSGGMGDVYQARDHRTDALVAVKVVGDGHKGNGSRFAREIRILADLEHPRIVRHLCDGVLDSGKLYLVMEWLDGEELLERLERGPLDLAESVTLARGVAEALGFAHARGVIHRDLKPGNLFLVGGKVEAVKVLDFGIAQLLAGARLTQTGNLVGTPGYMAPEQARGVEIVDARADVFSLGCVLYQCLTGEPAFAGGQILAVLARILFEEPPRAREKRPDAPAALDALIARMLSKNPRERPRDGHAVLEALRTIEEASSDAPRVSSSLLAALTEREQRAVAVSLIAPPPGGRDADLANAVTLELGETIAEGAELYGGHTERLLDGSVVVVMKSARLAIDLAAQAARCALSLRPRAQGRPMALALGRGSTKERLPMGPAIDRAVRLVASASGDAILLDEVMTGLLDARFDVRETKAGFALYGEHELAEGTRTLLGKATPCVGRDRELRQLEQLLDECVEDSEARAVVVRAPAGAGKSRFVHELLRRIKGRWKSLRVWVGHGDPLRAGSAFSLLGQPLRRACGIHDGEPLAVRRQKILDAARARLAEGAVRVAEFLGEIVGAPFPDDDSLSLRSARADPQLMNDQMRAAFVELLDAECAAGPVLILLENLHWGDHPTVKFLDRALRDLRARPLFVLALGRPEVRDVFPDLWSERRVQEISLHELNRKAIERLARHVLGEGVEAETLDRLARLSEGNAFYLEELIRSAAEGHGADLPETVVAMVQSRLGALDDEARRILRAASVFGETFWAGGVSALLGGAVTRPRLAELCEREVLVKPPESRFPGEHEYAFRHSLLREGAYAMLTDEDRALGHALAGEWLEAHGESDSRGLAEHFERGEQPERARAHHLRAAEQAHQAGDTDAAVAFAKRALRCVVGDEVELALLGLLSEAYAWRHDWSAAASYAGKVRRLATPGSGPWIRALTATCMYAIDVGNADEILGLFDTVLAVSPAPEAVSASALSLATCVIVLVSKGRLDLVEPTLQRLHEIVGPVAESDPIAAAWMHLAHPRWDAWVNEDPWSALQHAQIALAHFEASRHPRGMLIARTMLGMNAWFLGAPERAERELRDTLSADEELGPGASLRTVSLILLLAERGELAEARRTATRMIARGRAEGRALSEGHGRWALAHVLLREGDLVGAEREAQATDALLAQLPLERPATAVMLAAVHLAAGRAALALAAAERASLEHARVGGCSFFRGALIRLLRAESLHAVGDHAAAREAIAAARRRLLAIADTIGDAAYRESFLERVPENRKTLTLARAWLGEAGAGERMLADTDRPAG
jgi:hypothetical protein